MTPRLLHLHLTFKYFDEIKAETKPEEYRDYEKWREKIEGKEFDGIRLYRGYEKAGPDTVMDKPWRGYTVKTITHPHFKNVPKKVFVIPVLDVPTQGTRHVEN